MKLSLITILLALTAFVYAQDKPKWGIDLSAELQGENRFFFNPGLYPSQEQNFLSFSARPELEITNKDETHTYVIALFGRVDQHDNNRTHADIRELYSHWKWNRSELTVGFKKVFWGVTESVHLVDIINQTDQVEQFDGEAKLGQPMVNYQVFGKLGAFELYYLPYARKRQFPDANGRLRFPLVIERDDIEIRSDLDHWYPSFAFRWSHYFGPFDIGISKFHGVAREPVFLPSESGDVTFFYPTVDHSGLEMQLITGPWIWKFEGKRRIAADQDFTALATGFEYTFSNIAKSGLDIGVVSEYLYDSRDELAFTNFDNDLFLGSRFVFNDVKGTEILAGGIIDLDRSTRFYSIEAERRLGSGFKGEIVMRLFENTEQDEFAYFLREDDFLKISLTRFF
ncbi:MAG: hypothetical protein ACFB2Y_14835 [Fulvivirga sp.]